MWERDYVDQTEHSSTFALLSPTVGLHIILLHNIHQVWNKSLIDLSLDDPFQLQALLRGINQ